MLKYGLWIIICWLFGSSIQAQHTYSHLYNPFNEWEIMRSVFHNNTDGSFAFAAMTQNFGGTDSSNNRRIFISTIDSAGLMAQKKVIFGKNDCFLTIHDVYEYPNHTTLYFNIENQVLPDSFYYALIDIDKNGDTSNQRLIKLPEDNFAVTSHFTINNKIYSFGSVGNYNTSPFSLLVSDTSGKPIWFKKHAGKRTRANNVIMDTDGNFIIAGVKYRGDGITDTLFGWYTKMDTLGNFLWEKTMDGFQSFIANYGYITRANGSLFISGSNRYIPGFTPFFRDSSYAYIAQIDGNNGDVIFRKNFIYTTPDKRTSLGGLKQKNNALYGIMQYENNDGWAEYTEYILLVKLDLEGNLIWQRKFKQWYQDNRAYSLTPVDDGFIICADGKDTTHTTGFTDAWIIKTDTNGCVVPGCNLKDGMVQLLNPEAFLKVYPNPANNEVHIESTDAKATLQSIIVYYNNGSKLTQQTTTNQQHYTLNTHSLTNGNYYLVVELQTGERAVKKIMILHE